MTILGDEIWVCKHCKETNSCTYSFCKKCGKV